MAKKSGLNGKMYIAADGSTYVEVGNLTNVNIDEQTDMQDASDNSSGYRDFLAGLGAWTATADAFYNSADAGQDDVKDALSGKTRVDFKFVAEAGTGEKQWTGEGFISARSINLVNLDGPIASNLTITGCGALVEGVQA